MVIPGNTDWSEGQPYVTLVVPNPICPNGGEGQGRGPIEMTGGERELEGVGNEGSREGLH